MLSSESGANQAQGAVWIGLGNPETSPLVALRALGEGVPLLPHRFDLWTAIATRGVGFAAVVLALLALTIGFSPRRYVAVAVVTLSVLELVSFARAQRGGMPADFGYAINPWVRDVYAAAGERRVIEVKEAINFALGVRGYSLWGYDPIVSGRYTALIAASQGRDGSTLDNIDGEPPRHYHPVLAMLRADVELRFAEKRGVEMPRGLPNFWLVDRVQVVSDVDSAMNSVMDEAFDPSALVVLEASPQPLPVPPVTAEIEVLDVGTDHVDLRIDTERAAVLVVGDAYASGWRAVSLPGSAAGEYRVEPANVALRSVALGPGHHRLRLEYRPAYANIALAVSGAGTALFASGLGVWALRRSRAA